VSKDQQVHKRMLLNVRTDVGARVLYLFTRFFIPPFVLAHIGMEAYGFYGTVFILVAYIGVSTVGFSNAYIKYVAEYAAGGQYEKANGILSAGIFVTSPVALLVFLGFTTLWSRIAVVMKVPVALNADARFLTFTIVGSFLMCLGLSAYRDALSGLQMIATVQKIWIASFVAETILIFTLVGRGWGLKGMGVAFLVRSIIDLGASAVVAIRYVPWLRVSPRMVSREALRKLFGFGSIVQINSMLAIFLNTIERVIAAPVVGLQAAGLLDISTKLPYMALSLPSAFAGAALPSVSDLHGRDNTEENRTASVRGLYLVCSRYMSGMAGSLLGFMAVFTVPMLLFWLKKLPDGAPLLMLVFAVASQVHLMTGPGTSMMKGIGRPRMEFHYSLANVVTLCLLVPLSRFIFGSWSAKSIGVGVASATVCAAIYFISIANRTLGVSAGTYLKNTIWPGFVPYLAAASTWLFLRVLPMPEGRIRIGFWLCFASLIYGGILAAYWWMFSATQAEKEAVRNRLWIVRRFVPA